MRGLVTDLDRGLCADPALAELPGRTLFTLDDGTGDISGLRGDFGVHALDDGRFALSLRVRIPAPGSRRRTRSTCCWRRRARSPRSAVTRGD